MMTTVKSEHSAAIPGGEQAVLSASLQQRFVSIEQKLDQLVQEYQQHTARQEELRSQQQDLLTEQQALIEQNEQSRARIDAMVARLKGLEQSQ